MKKAKIIGPPNGDTVNRRTGEKDTARARTLDMMEKGESAVIRGISTGEDIGRRLRDVGFCNGTRVRCIMKSPLGDPSAYLVRGTLIALRCEDSGSVIIG